MTDPDVRVVVQGLKAAEQKLEQILRERRRIERMVEEARRRLERVDQDLARVERQLRYR